MVGSNYEQEMFLEELPRWEEGKNKGSISWFNTLGYNVRFIYDNIEGYVKIIGYESKKQELTILYDDKEFNIKTNLFIKCRIGRIIGKITKEFKYNIGQIIKDDKRDMAIVDREYREDKIGYKRRWYKYTCNRCNWTEGWIIEGHIDEGNGCSCCTNRTPVLGINTIWDTDKWMIPIINDDEFCKTHTHSCSDSIYPTCADCGRIKSKKMTINTIYGRHGIPCICSDNFSYPEKVMFGILEQLEIKFEYHKTFNWSQNKEYDFNISDKIIIETHGSQHYQDGKFSTMKGARSHKEEVENDKLKKQLALNNGILEANYIIIDCRNTYLKCIKNDILKSNLVNIYDLSIIDWNKVEEFASSNLIKTTCEHKKNNPNLFTGDISKIMNICQTTIGKYLKIGNKLGWCIYDVDEEKRKTGKRCSLANCKKVKCIELNKIFNSLKECSQYFKENLNIRLISSNIGMVCNNKSESYKGYHFEFVNKYESDNTVLLKAI